MTQPNLDQRGPYPSATPKLDAELRASGLSVVLTVHAAGETSLAFIPIRDATDQDFPSDVLHTIADRFRSDAAFRMGMTAYLTHVGAVYVAAPPASATAAPPHADDKGPSEWLTRLRAICGLSEVAA